MQTVKRDNRYKPFVTQVGRGQLCVCAAEDICTQWLESLEKTNVDSNGAPQAGLIVSCGIEEHHNIDRAIFSRRVADKHWDRIVWQFVSFHSELNISRRSWKRSGARSTMAKRSYSIVVQEYIAPRFVSAK